MITPEKFGFISRSKRMKCSANSRMEGHSKKQIGRSIKKLKTDNGREFCNKEFEELCRNDGIVRYHTIPGTL